jgi:hypothetical protein
MQFDPGLLSRYVMLRKWGAHFFAPREMKGVLDTVARQYYEALIRAGRRKDRVQYFKFHRSVLARAGYRWELAKACAAFAALAGNWLTRNTGSRGFS